MAGGDSYPDFSAGVTTLGIPDEVVAQYIAGDTPAQAADEPLMTGIHGRIVCEGATCPVPIAAP